MHEEKLVKLKQEIRSMIKMMKSFKTSLLVDSTSRQKIRIESGVIYTNLNPSEDWLPRTAKDRKVRQQGI